jgi:hypothetical protein
VNISKAQLKIGNNPATINPSAAFEIESADKGFIPPRIHLISLTDGITIQNPATGLIVYNTNDALTTRSGIYVNSGTSTSPEWGRLESNTSTTGGSTRKLIYRGAVDPTKPCAQEIWSLDIGL